MSSSYLSEIDLLFSALDGQNLTNTTICKPVISHYRFYQFVLIPAVVLTVIFSMFETRKSFKTHLLGGRPGCLYPMDALTRSSRLSYACAFGATVFVLFRIIFEQQFAFEYTGPLYLTTLVSIVSVIIYGMAFYPVFACLTLGTGFSYGLGTLYVWMYSAVQFYTTFECDVTLAARFVLLARDLPNLACWVYLSISIPCRFIRSLKRKNFFRVKPGPLEREQSVQGIRKSYQGHAVKSLLVRPKPPKPPPQGIVGKIARALSTLVHEWLYHWKKDFHYSSRMLSVVVVAIQIIYIITFELISTLYPFMVLYLEGIWFLVEQVGAARQVGELPSISNYREALLLTYYILNALSICFVVSAVVAFVLGLVLILHMLSSYRRNLQALYRADFSHVPPLEARGNASHMVGFLRYAGYQIGYIGWAYIVQFTVLLIVTSGLASAITLINLGFDKWLLNYILQLWPVVLIAIILNVLQILLAKFIFLDGNQMAMTNRRVLFVFTYFMFFFNVFLGFFSCLMRIIKSIVIGTLLLGRLDHSSLTRRFQFLDPGFAAYVGFLHVENAHTHPCVLVFVRLMLMNLQTKQHTLEMNYGDVELAERVTSARRKAFGAKFNWHVAYTLLNNPSLRMYRKGYIQGLQKDLKEGKRRQVSDSILDDMHAYDAEKNDAREAKMEGTNGEIGRDLKLTEINVRL